MKFILRAALLGSALLLSACQTSVEQRPQAVEIKSKPAFALARGTSVLVMPFNCNILPADYGTAGLTLQNGFSGWLIQALQSSGVHADDYAAMVTGCYSAPSREIPPGVYLPLTPESRLQTDFQGFISAAPLHDGQWEDDLFSASLTADETPPAEGLDAGVMPEGTRMVSPRAAETGHGRSVAPGYSINYSQTADKNHLEQALSSGHDYVLTGNIVFLHTEVKPLIQHDNRKATTVRGEFNCAWRLLEAGSGKIMASGAANGKAGKYVALGSGSQEDSLINGAVSQVINQSMSLAARNTVSQLQNPDAPEKRDLYDSQESDREYYLDSPGKRLRPGY